MALSGNHLNLNYIKNYESIYSNTKHRTAEPAIIKRFMTVLAHSSHLLTVLSLCSDTWKRLPGFLALEASYCSGDQNIEDISEEKKVAMKYET